MQASPFHRDSPLRHRQQGLGAQGSSVPSLPRNSKGRVYVMDTATCSMKLARFMSRSERPAHSWVLRVMWTLLYTLNHSGWWSSFSACRATLVMNPKALLKSLKWNCLKMASRPSSSFHPTARRFGSSWSRSSALSLCALPACRREKTQAQGLSFYRSKTGPCFPGAGCRCVESSSGFLRPKSWDLVCTQEAAPGSSKAVTRPENKYIDLHRQGHAYCNEKKKAAKPGGA